jgi:HJR/Mrr/RecB family endonuclease
MVVAKFFWQNISDIIGLKVGDDFESVAKYWLSEKKFKTVNVCTIVVIGLCEK